MSETEKNLKLQIDEADALISQIDHLFDAYFRGLEKMAPSPKRSLLKTIMMRLHSSAKINPQERFRYVALSNRYQLFEDKWERALRKRERT